MSEANTLEYSGASKRAIQHHYDVGNKFWELWLDPTMTYSCAMWADGDTLESAQRQKVDAYRTFFDRCHGFLRPGGWMTLQTIAKGDVALDARGLRDLNVITKMFPESDLPHPADVVTAVEGLFEVVAMRNDREHYI